jgi:hypothetical protein
VFPERHNRLENYTDPNPEVYRLNFNGRENLKSYQSNTDLRCISAELGTYFLPFYGPRWAERIARDEASVMDILILLDNLKEGV